MDWEKILTNSVTDQGLHFQNTQTTQETQNQKQPNEKNGHVDYEGYPIFSKEFFPQ